MNEGPLRRILAAREERAQVQAFLLSLSSSIVQIALNVPGFPKRLPFDENALSLAFEDLFAGIGEPSPVRVSLVNAAGAALLAALPTGDPRDVKFVAVALEEREGWCRVLDIDVLTCEGILTRNNVGRPPRRCLLCGDEAKACARLQRHDAAALRRIVSEMLRNASRRADSVPPRR